MTQFSIKPNTTKNVTNQGEESHFVENGKVHHILDAKVIIEETSAELFDFFNVQVTSIILGVTLSVLFLLTGFFLNSLWIVLAAIELTLMFSFVLRNVKFMKVYLVLQIVEALAILVILAAIVAVDPKEINKSLISHGYFNLASFFALPGVMVYTFCFSCLSILRIVFSFKYIKHVSLTNLRVRLTNGMFTLVAQI